jgi:hypothetical protein
MIIPGQENKTVNGLKDCHHVLSISLTLPVFYLGSQGFSLGLAKIARFIGFRLYSVYFVL